MLINTRLVSETITYITQLFNSQQHVAYWARLFEEEAIPNDIIDHQEAIGHVTRTAKTIEEHIDKLSALYPFDDLQPYFQRVTEDAKGMTQLVTGFEEYYLRKPLCKLSEDAICLLDDLTHMNNALAEHVANRMPLSGVLISAITPEIVAQHPQAAIEYAFTVFEDHLRKRIEAAPDVFAVHLIDQAFGDRGRLTMGSTPAEDVGVRNLMTGAYLTFRNPHMHRLLATDPQMVSTIIIIIDLLIRTVDDAKDRPNSNT